ncbi:hypothetical protein ANCCAN_11545 [Ancylostoma caninum]|uniref:HAT C-terminal dimerisation domain-containing protein n=1 Tax=Ancylostoma caninum TaxID=29170 RepID=A0A368GGT7_ANCCA|nr:hypothetical protein ANCCAN_11545 [Ancylostoma caninum]
MPVVAENLGVKYVHCCAHVINLIVARFLEIPAAANLIRRVKRVVTRLNKKAKAKFCYKRYLEEMSPPTVIPSSDCPTRWSSTFTMLCDVLNARSRVGGKRSQRIFRRASPTNKALFCAMVSSQHEPVMPNQRNQRVHADAPVWEILTQSQEYEENTSSENTIEDEIEIEIQRYAMSLKRARPILTQIQFCNGERIRKNSST